MQDPLGGGDQNTISGCCRGCAGADIRCFLRCQEDQKPWRQNP